MEEEKSAFLPGPLSNLKEINFGIVLLAAYILLDFGSFQGVFDYIIMPLRIPFIVAMFSSIYAVYLLIRKKVEFKGTTNIFIIMVLYIIIDAQIRSSAISSEHILTLFIQYLSNYIIMVACVKTRFQFIFLLDVFLAGILHSSFHAIMQGGKLWDSIWLKDENHISLIAAYAIPLAYVLLMNYKSKIKRICYLTAAAFFISAVAVAASRGGAVAMIACGFFCCLLYKKKVRNLVILAMVVVLLFSFAPTKFFQEVDSLKQGTEEGTANERIYLWGIALAMFYDHPIVGVGPMNYPLNMMEYDIKREFRFERRVFVKGRKPMAAHSTIVTWLAEFGMVGTIMLIYLQINMYRNWRIGTRFQGKQLVIDERTEDYKIIRDISHAIAIAHIVFWVAASFLTLLPYPFYWILIPFSETWKNITLNYTK